MSQVALNTLVAHYLERGRDSELSVLEKEAKKGRNLKERLPIMVAFAKARVAHLAFRKRWGLSSN
jgi:hypothetical protein